MAAKKKLTEKQQAKLDEQKRVDGIRAKAPREVFLVIASGYYVKGEPVGVYRKKRVAQQNAEPDEIVMGPFVLAERKRNG